MSAVLGPLWSPGGASTGNGSATSLNIGPGPTSFCGLSCSHCKHLVSLCHTCGNHYTDDTRVGVNALSCVIVVVVVCGGVWCVVWWCGGVVWWCGVVVWWCGGVVSVRICLGLVLSRAMS